MQSEQYQEFADDPEFAKHLIEIDPRQIVKYRQTARSKGDENINANKYYAQFSRGIRQTVPVSVKRTIGRPMSVAMESLELRAAKRWCSLTMGGSFLHQPTSIMY